MLVLTEQNGGIVKGIFLSLCCILPIQAQAEVYKCVKNGVTSYSDSECVGATVIGGRTAISSPALTEGLTAFESGNYDVALSKLTPLAKSNVALAQNTLGKMYLQGQGVPEDPSRAFALFSKAADQGLPNAQTNVGVMYASGIVVSQDYKTAIEWFRKAANQGFQIAMENLSSMYENGLGVKPDPVEAEKWRKKSRGIAAAQEKDLVKVRTVGQSDFDEGLQAYYGYRFVEAAKLFTKAAQAGNPEAQLRLSIMYEQGQGVAQNISTAQYWKSKAKKGAHSMDDNRDRVILIDTGSSKSKSSGIGTRP